jgi:hypothetical protein
LQEIDVEMDHVELIGAPADVVEHYEVARDMIADARQPQPFVARMEPALPRSWNLRSRIA